ncbi:MAG: acyltransferase family protein, partial [Oscillospiraceae bacterium]
METIAAPLPGAAVAAPKRARWFRADNIRYILLFNVIAEHMLTQTDITYNWLVTVLVCWSRMITMPGFCFISGYFSKKGDKCYQSAIFDFLIPYIIFNSLFVLCYGSSAPNIFTPTFAYWYMMCMFAWKLVTKALQQIKYILPLSILVALAVGCLDDVGHFLSLSRTIGFLPFYLIGMKMSREDVQKIEDLPRLPVAIVTLAVMGVWGWLNVKGVFHIDFYYYWLPYGGSADPQCMFHYGILKGLILRALGYVISLIQIVFLFVFIPNRSLPVMRDGGTRTMVPYLLHTYVIMFMKNVYFLVPALDRWYITIPVALLIAVGVMTVLGLPIFNDWYNALVKWIKKLLYKEPDAA